MMLRGVLWAALVWLYMPNWLHFAGSDPLRDCAQVGCVDPVRQAGDAWRTALMARLDTIRAELNASPISWDENFVVGKCNGEAVSRGTGRLAEADTGELP